MNWNKIRPRLFSRSEKARPILPVDSSAPNPGVRIVDGLIRPNYSCQSEIVSHCNLACSNCNHASPVADKGYTSPDTLYRDYSLLAKVYRPQFVHLTGGEPLLHPDVVGAIEAVRASGITDQVCIMTNGLRLSRMNDAFWQAVDALEVSLYPVSKIQADEIATWEAKAGQHGVKLEIYRFDDFRRAFSTTRNPDDALVQRIYDGCKAAHVWGCHYVHEGYMYRCPQSIFVPRVLGLLDDTSRRDGIELSDAPGFQDELFRFLTSPEPLQACWNCLANTGIQAPHVQIKRSDWRASQSGPIATQVDFRNLAQDEAARKLIQRDRIKALVTCIDTAATPSRPPK